MVIDESVEVKRGSGDSDSDSDPYGGVERQLWIYDTPGEGIYLA